VREVEPIGGHEVFSLDCSETDDLKIEESSIVSQKIRKVGEWDKRTCSYVLRSP